MMLVGETTHASASFMFNSLPVAGDAYSMAEQCSFSTDILVPFHVQHSYICFMAAMVRWL